MADCKITLPITDTNEVFVAKMKNMVQKAGGEISGNDNTGNFSIGSPMGSITGNYEISNGVILITITDKPFLISCSAIQGILEAQIK